MAIANEIRYKTSVFRYQQEPEVTRKKFLGAKRQGTWACRRPTRPVADVVPHRRDTGRRRFVPVAEVAEAFVTEPVPDPIGWQTDLAAADEVFGMDEPTDPFERRRH